MTAPPRIAVIGAGPIGLETALLAAQSGFNVQVYERGSVAANVKDWGHVRLFSPFGMNASEWGRQAVVAACGDQLPDVDALLTGCEFVERYLLPLSRLRELQDRIHERCEVRAISRSRSLKGDLIGNPQRGNDPFQLLSRNGDGERIVEADIVLDCSGTYPHHNWLGAGGMPCLGELDAQSEIVYRLPDVFGTDRERFANRTTLVVGGGYSAATVVVALAKLSEEETETTRAIWLTRTDRRLPIRRFDDDLLPERDGLAERANRLAIEPDGPVEWHGATVVRRIQRSRSGSFVISAEQCLGDRTQLQEWQVDRVIANVGYHPDRRLTEELQFHECYATGGPMKLAAALLRETSADCLSQSSHGAETLRNPEPGYFVLGSKSYGRDSRFLLSVGLQQIRDLMSLIQMR